MAYLRGCTTIYHKLNHEGLIKSKNKMSKIKKLLYCNVSFIRCCFTILCSFIQNYNYFIRVVVTRRQEVNSSWQFCRIKLVYLIMIQNATRLLVSLLLLYNLNVIYTTTRLLNLTHYVIS